MLWLAHGLPTPWLTLLFEWTFQHSSVEARRMNEAAHLTCMLDDIGS